MQRPWAYVDTSLLALRYLESPDGPLARRLMREHRLVTSSITPLELASVFGQRVASGILTEEARDAAVRRLDDDEGSWDEMPVSGEVLQGGREVVRQTGARALDAIHLATALAYRDAGHGSLVFLTRDAQQGRAARALGLDVRGLPAT